MSSSTSPMDASSRTRPSAAPTTRSTARPATRSTSRSSSPGRRARGSTAGRRTARQPRCSRSRPRSRYASPSGPAGCPARCRSHGPTGRARPRFRTTAARTQGFPLGLRSLHRLLGVPVDFQLARHEQRRSRQRHRELVDRLRRRDLGERELEHESADRGRPRLFPFFSTCVGFGGFAFVCPVTLTVTDCAGQSNSDTLVMGFLDLTPD